MRTKALSKRRGAVLVLAAAMMVVIFAFLAFTLDVGYIALTRTQLQAAADAAALGAGLELIDGLGLLPERSASEVDSLARQAAEELAAMHSAGELSSVYLNPERDVLLGRYEWDEQTGEWTAFWGVAPYNLVRVTLHRDQVYPGQEDGQPVVGDEELRLFFAPALGHRTAAIRVRAAAALLPGVGFRVNPGSEQTVPVLPIALDEPSWNALLEGEGTDEYCYDCCCHCVCEGSDGVLEINIYPEAAPGNPRGNGNGTNQWTPGNRGTIDLGNPNNATPDLERQILYGLNEEDLSYFGGELSFDDGPIEVNGDPGISAAIKDELAAIIGEPRALPLFSEVTGQGNNTYYKLVRFVGIRIMAVKLTGNNKYVIVQPATLVDETVVPGAISVSDASLFTPVRLVE